MAMRLPDRLRLPFAFDSGALARDLAGLSALGWTRHVVRQNYEGDWGIIALRAAAGERHPVRLTCPSPLASEFADLPALTDCPHIRDVLGVFHAPLRAVRLMRLAPGSAIKEHSDLDLSFEDGTVRIHVPVLTNAKVDFRLNGSRLTMEPGSAWYLRLSDPHSVTNGGETDRVHLVIDATANDWMADMLLRAARLCEAA
jgi:hypothetical protein